MGKSFYNYRSQNSSLKRGSGIINKLINTLPFEAHIPGYNFCGPGTKLKKRLERGDRGINPLDEACRIHDIAYSQHKELSERHKADADLINKAWDRVTSGDSSLGEKTAAYLVTNIMKTKKKFGMGMKKRKKGAKRKCRKRGAKAKTFSNVIQTGIRALKKQKPLDLMSAIKVARKAVSKSIGRNKKKIKIPRVINVPKVGGFLPLVPILTALSALGSVASGSAAIAKAINNASTSKKQLEESKRHNKKMESISVGEGMFLKPYRKGYGLYLNPFRGNQKN